MPGKATGYEIQQTDDLKPMTLHGVKEVPLLIMQCADKRNKTQVLLGVEIEPGDVRILPEDTWEKLGRPAKWLQEQLTEARHPKMVQKAPQQRRRSPKAAASLPRDRVDV